MCVTATVKSGTVVDAMMIEDGGGRQDDGKLERWEKIIERLDLGEGWQIINNRREVMLEVFG